MSPTPTESDSIENTADEFAIAFQHVVAEVFRFRSMLLAAGEQATRDLDISVGCWQAMAVVLREPMTVADISRRLGLTRQSVQLSVNRLLKKNLLETLPNPGHRRASLIKLSPAGTELMDILRQRQSTLAEHFTGNLGYTSEDMQSLAEHLARMREQAIAYENNNTG